MHDKRCPICGEGSLEPRESVIRATLSGRAEAISCRYTECDCCGHIEADREAHRGQRDGY